MDKGNVWLSFTFDAVVDGGVSLCENLSTPRTDSLLVK